MRWMVLAGAALFAVACAKGGAEDCAACPHIVPGTEISVPDDYPQGGKLHFSMRVAAFASRQLWAPPAPGGVAMVGDSITEGGDWERFLPGAATVNFGVSWDQTTGLYNRLGQISAAEPSKIVLLIGTNDIGNGRSAEATAGNAARVVEAMTQIVPPERILVQAVMPRQAQFRHEIETLNARLEEIAAEAGTDFIDLYTPFLVDGALDPSVTGDSLHLNEEGYRRWAGLIAGWVAE